jgi:ABC-type transport system substrate-binding protein
LLAQGTQELNPVERARIYRQLERQVLEQAPMVPLYHTMGIVAVRSDVRGLTPTPLGLAKVDLEKVWLLAERRDS